MKHFTIEIVKYNKLLLMYFFDAEITDFDANFKTANLKVNSVI